MRFMRTTPPAIFFKLQAVSRGSLIFRRTVVTTLTLSTRQNYDIPHFETYLFHDF
mgnify:FL=1|jgi:hypothetical protein